MCCQTSTVQTKMRCDRSPRKTGVCLPVNPLRFVSPVHDPNCLLQEDNNITIREDDTCILMSIEMPNVHHNDVQISLHKNVLTLSGYRSSSFHSEESHERRACMDRSSTKRQRFSRQLELDLEAIDINRAMASTWEGCYTLYAPKRRPYSY